MNLILLTIFFFLSTLCFSQPNKKVFEIDSMLQAGVGIENYRYWYGGNDNYTLDFRMDTAAGKLIRFRFIFEGEDTIKIDYFFIDNYLTKVKSTRNENDLENTIGTYYFENNEVFYKTGENVKFKKEGIFEKISPEYFHRQLNYIYSQYEYFNMDKKRFNINVPKLLKEKRKEIDDMFNKYK